MKLLFIHDHPFYKIGNDIYTSGAFTKDLWNNYLLLFIEVNIYSRRLRVEPINKILSSRKNVNFHLTDNYSSLKVLFFHFFNLKKEIERLVLENDVILIRLPSILGLIAGFIALKHKKYIWVEQVGNAEEAMLNHGSFIGKISAPILHLLNKRIIKKAHFISYVTEGKLQKDYPCNLSALQVSLSDVMIHNILESDDVDILRFTSDIFKIGVIGGFDTRYKGFDVLLKAVSLLPLSKKNKIELYFIGKGDSEWIKKMAMELDLIENIKFIGPLKAGEEINNILSTLSLYVQPSLTEGMPRALLEAMAMGCPCLGSNVGGIPDILDIKNIHMAGDHNQLAEHVKFYIDNREKLAEQSQINLNRIKPYLFDNLNKKRLNFYSEMKRIITS